MSLSSNPSSTKTLVAGAVLLLVGLGAGWALSQWLSAGGHAGAPATAAAAETVSPATPDAHQAPTSMPMVDVVGKLTAMAAANPQKLNWQVSIVDLLKLLGLESSLDARKQMASELGCPTDKMADSAHMNMWLHKTVLAKLAANGGNIPADLL